MRRRSRWALAIGLVVVASLLTPVTLVARYLRSEILDTDRYVATVTPLVRDPAVRDAVADELTRVVFRALDVEDLTEDALQDLVDRGAPGIVVGLATPITVEVERFVREEVGRLLATDQFERLWVEANRVAHDQLDAVLTGRDGPFDTTHGRVSLDLGDMVARIRQQLLQRGFELAERIPDVEANFTILESDRLERAQEAVRWLDRAATYLPLVVLALAVAAIMVAPDRRRGLFAVAVGITLALLLLAAALALARVWYLDHGTPRALPPATAVRIAEILLAPLRDTMRSVLVLGLAVAVGAYLAGPSPAGRAVRGVAGRAAAAARDRIAGGREPSAVEIWVGAHKSALRLATLVLAGLVFVLWTYPSARTVGAVVLVVLAVLAAIELIGRAGVGPTEPASPIRPTS